MKKYKFTIGDYVDCSGYIIFYRDDAAFLKRDYQKIDKSFSGFIVGMTYRKAGVVAPGCYVDGEDYEPPYFVPKETIRVWKVRESLTSKEKEVLEEDIILNSNQNVSVPNRVSHNLDYYKSEKFRNIMREEMASWPRDNRGRWEKYLYENKKVTDIVILDEKDKKEDKEQVLGYIYPILKY